MDWYSKQAQNQKLRSRSWFKLQSIDYLDKLIKKNMTVIDLGSAPGGWSSYLNKKIGDKGKIISCDMLPMRKIDGVDFLQGDCSNPDFLRKIFSRMQCKKVQVILSDMSPNTTGISIIDVYKSIYLGKIALSICCHVLIFGGSFLVKIFQGEDFDQYLHDVQSLFNIVKIRKPHSSRSGSREVYIVAKGFRYKI